MQVFDKAKDFIWRNARLLDRRRFSYAFEGGSGEAVLTALRAYQNEDGGFGHALEPDIRCPDSQPVPLEMALQIMDETNTFQAEMLQDIARYLRQITLDGGGFPFIHRTAASYPHAPWWSTERDDVPSMNPTGKIIGLLWKQQAWTEIQQENWFVAAADFVWRTMEQTEPNGYHEAVQWIAFLRYAPDQERARKYLRKLDAWLTKPGVIERNIHAEGYVHKILDWAPSPDDYARQFVSEADIEAHLDDLLAKQQDDGGWPITWEAISPLTELEWRGYLTVERLKTLRAYGRI